MRVKVPGEQAFACLTLALEIRKRGLYLERIFSKVWEMVRFTGRVLTAHSEQEVFASPQLTKAIVLYHGISG